MTWEIKLYQSWVVEKQHSLSTRQTSVIVEKRPACPATPPRTKALGSCTAELNVIILSATLVKVEYAYVDETLAQHKPHESLKQPLNIYNFKSDRTWLIYTPYGKLRDVGHWAYQENFRGCLPSPQSRRLRCIRSTSVGTTNGLKSVLSIGRKHVLRMPNCAAANKDKWGTWSHFNIFLRDIRYNLWDNPFRLPWFKNWAQKWSVNKNTTLLFCVPTLSFSHKKHTRWGNWQP